jgi:hypothetical protein
MGLLDGFLGNGWEDPRSQALMALSAGLLRRDMGGGLLAANQAFMQARSMQEEAEDRKMKRGLLSAQIKDKESEVAQRDAAIQAAQRKQQALSGLFTAPTVPGQLGSGSFGAVQPPAGAPSVPAPSFNWQAALQAGYTPDEIQKLQGLTTMGTPEVARTVEVPGPNGQKMLQQLDKFGRPVGQPVPMHEAAQFLNLGNRQVAAVPRAGMSFDMGMSPTDRDASARGWASLNETQRHNRFNEGNAAATREAGKVPAGYRMKADGTLEFIPGGPADPNAARKAAPTEWQGKSAMFGARASEADKILSSLTGQYSPAAVNAKIGAGNVPMIGGVLEPIANTALSSNSQKAEQAQRDFVNAVLRLESGAAISEGEFANARKQYFPQPGDSAAVIAQKAKNRALAIQGLMQNARPGTVPEPQTGSVGGTWNDQNDPLGLRR